MSHPLCELSIIEPTRSSAASDHNKRITLLSLSGPNPPDWACLPAQRCEGLSFIQQRVVCLYAHTAINSADTIYLPGTREVTFHIVCPRWGQVVSGGGRRVRVCERRWGVGSCLCARHTSQAAPCGRSRGA